MAKIDLELPSDLMQEFERLDKDTSVMLENMTSAGAKTAMELIKANLKKSFKTDKSLIKGLRLTKTYKTPSDDGVATKVIFAGYNDKGVAIPLIAMAREYGTSRGEVKKPFLRPAFRQKEKIESAMLLEQEKYIKGD
jgi:hypothetical protein